MRDLVNRLLGWIGRRCEADQPDRRVNAGDPHAEGPQAGGEIERGGAVIVVEDPPAEPDPPQYASVDVVQTQDGQLVRFVEPGQVGAWIIADEADALEDWQ